jgi:hypothetical protein
MLHRLGRLLGRVWLASVSSLRLTDVHQPAHDTHCGVEAPALPPVARLVRPLQVAPRRPAPDP